jgi:hypothetical protein
VDGPGCGPGWDTRSSDGTPAFIPLGNAAAFEGIAAARLPRRQSQPNGKFSPIAELTAFAKATDDDARFRPIAKCKMHDIASCEKEDLLVKK